MEGSKNAPYLSNSAPSTGGPTSDEVDAKAMPIPMYVPRFCRLSVQTEKAADAPEMMVPEKKANATAYNTSAAVLFTVVMISTRMPVINPPRPKTFSLPYLSAIMPGMMRPNVEAALRMARRYDARVGFIPVDTAYVGR